MEIIRNLKNNAINIPGWHTRRKIVVIESDDWGAIRMSSKAVYDKLLKAGYSVDNRPYEKYDSLASEQDISMLFEVLTRFRDKNGNHPVITANSLVVNPDFEKIKDSGYEEYHYELFTETLKRYSNHANSFDLWKEGMNYGVFFPQFHGREHINVNSWMKALQRRDKDVMLAFEYGLPGIFPRDNAQAGNQFVVALKFADAAEFENIKTILKDGLQLFSKIHGYRSASFIAPCNTWHPDYAETLKENGINIIQGSSVQLVPSLDKISKRYHYVGQKNEWNQYFLIRNCSFEPTEKHNVDNIDGCLHSIDTAFRWRKPAIISSHRLNYIGSIFPENRDRNLKRLEVLLTRIIAKWPDVEFMTSAQLGDLLIKN